MLFSKNLLIKQKITAIIMLVSTLVLLSAATIFVVHDSFLFKKALVEKHSILAGIICSNLTAALSFDDQEAGEKTLAALQVDPMILNAQIFLPNGDIFARYAGPTVHKSKETQTKADRDRQHMASDLTMINLLKSTEQYHFHADNLYIFMPVTLDKEIIGVLGIQASTQALKKQIKLMVITYSLIIIGLALVAYLLSRRLAGKIIDPIDRLAETMQIVSSTRDYSVRAEKKGKDELGVLIDGFNDMLVRIQKRDQNLYFTQFSIDHAGVAAFWMEPSGRLFYVNSAAIQSLGYTREELLSMSIEDFTPNLSEKLWTQHWLEIREKGSITFEITHQRKNGEFFPIEITSNYLEFQGKEYNCAFARDISDKKRMENQLQQSEKMKAIGSLTAGVAHDLNNILCGLVGYPELLLMDLPSDDPQRETLETIKVTGEKAAAVVQDLLTLARRGVATLQVMNLNHSLAEYFSSPVHLQLESSNPKIKFIKHFDPDLMNIFAYPTHLSKTIMNLAVNAVESMPAGGELTFTTRNIYLEQEIHGIENIKPGEYVRLSISDTGTGISPGDIDKIFEPFYTKKRMGKSGTGLGMTVVWSTVKDANGFINVTSTEGEGTCFDMYYPICRDKLADKTEPTAIEDYLGNEKILVVDDVPEQRDIAAKMLGKLGYAVTALSCGEDAIEFMRNNSADLLVLDMIMEPGIDGLETYQKILQINPGQKAVLASGYSESDRVVEAQRLGAGRYIKKPYSLEHIGVAVRMELDG